MTAEEFYNGTSAADAPHECFTCGTPIDPYDAYCDACIADQIRANGGMTELQAFDAYHAWVDKLTES